MKLYKQKSLSDRLYSKVVEDIGHSIRQQIISERKNQSVKKVKHTDFLSKTKTQQNPQKSFWLNPYKTQKTKWKLSQPNFIICEKQDIDQYKKYQLLKFKQKLKSKLEERQHTKQQEIRLNRSRIRQFRFYGYEAHQQKLENFIYHKQSQTELFKRNLEKKKMQARILKRQKALQLEFKKWHRQEQKLLKHKKKLIENNQRFRTTLY